MVVRAQHSVIDTKMHLQLKWPTQYRLKHFQNNTQATKENTLATMIHIVYFLMYDKLYSTDTRLFFLMNTISDFFNQRTRST